LTLEELQAELDKLPSQDPHYQIGFLMRRVVLLMNQRDPYWKWLRALQHKIVLAKKGKGSYNRKRKHRKEMVHDE